MIISFILMTLMCDSRVILLVEIRRQSLLKVKVLSITWGHEKGGGRGGGCGGGFCLCHNKTNVPDFPIRLCHIPSSLIIN